MANPDHLAELKKGVESWNQWRTSHQLAHPILSGANLSGTILSGANLSGTILSGANLTGADLNGADLYGTNLRGATLSGANLSGTNLREAYLSGANLSGAHLRLDDLSGAHLEGADLHGADLYGTNLRGATLSGANLSGAKLSVANLSVANLERANLNGADLSGANLERADLCGADLCGANPSGATFEGATLEQASCGDTTWARVNLLQTIGLSTLIHRSQSSLGTNTLVLSKGRLPVEFLKGCGLADWEIEGVKLYDPDLTTAEITDIQYRIYDLLARAPIQISPVFISYSHGDTPFVDSLGSMLDKRGVRYWRDIKDATAGRLDKVIERGISLNPTLLLVLSEHAIESDWVEYEVDKAVQLSKQLNRDVLCPIALDKAWLDSDRLSGNLRTQIKKYNVLDFGAHNDATVFDTQFRKLIDGLGLHYRDLTGPAMGTSNRP